MGHLPFDGAGRRQPALVRGLPPARIMGLRQAWQHDALFDYQDRYMATEPHEGYRCWDPFTEAMWDAYRGHYPTQRSLHLPLVIR